MASRANARRRLLLLILLLTCSAVLLRQVARQRGEWLPAPYNPWARLQIGHAPNVLTRFKLARLDRNRAACLTVLAGSGFRYRVLPDRQTAPGCGFDNAVRIEATSIEVDAPFSLSCRSAVALAMWERHALQPAARRHLSGTVVRIEHFGSYACRNIGGRSGAARSRHATADALDIAGLVLADGRRVRVLADWPGTSAESAFLHAVHRDACRFFGTVLGPDYDRAHRDHFHFDRGGIRLCR